MLMWSSRGLATFEIAHKSKTGGADKGGGAVQETRRIDLDGIWKVASYEPAAGDERVYPQLDGLEWIKATVPGAIPYDLIAAGKLTNPLQSKRAAEAAAWVAQGDWIYATTFPFDNQETASSRVYIQLREVDTFADIWMNGVFVGETANMYRVYRFDIGNLPLKPTDNELLIHIKGHYRMVEHMVPEAERKLAIDRDSRGYKSLVRRYQRGFAVSLLNLGTPVISIGIGGSVEIQVCPEIYITDYHLVTTILSDGTAKVRVEADISKDGNEAEEVTAEALLWRDDRQQPEATEAAATTGSQAVVELSVQNPRLWWPRGYGEPNLYNLTISLYRSGAMIHTITERVGLKQVDLVQRLENGRKTFFFRVNRKRVYVRGGNLVPIDALQAKVPKSVYRRMLRLVTNANMNMLRIWGGGLPEHPDFLDLCEEMGIMIWQEYFYHSTTYPDYDTEFMAEAEREAIDVVRYMRNRACLTLLSGGNEQQEGWDKNWWKAIDRFYGEKLINEVGPRVSGLYAPEIPYIPNSPHGGKWSQSPVEGDTHTWGNFYNATKDPQFVTETCWNQQSYSRPETLKEAMGLDVNDFSEPGWYKKWEEVTGLRFISNTLYSEYHDVGSLRDYLHVLEIEHHQADYFALSMLRTRSSSCNGIIYWPLNKPGPLFVFGGIDYLGRPMMPYYAVQKVFSDVLVHVYHDVDDIRIVGSNLTSQVVSGSLRISHVNAKGHLLGRWEVPVSMEPANSIRLFDIEGYYERIIDRTDEMIYVELTVGGQTLSHDALYFCPLSEYNVLACQIDCRVERITEDSWDLELETHGVVKLVDIRADSRILLSENCFSMIPGFTKRVRVTLLEAPLTRETRLTVSALDNPCTVNLVL